MPDLRSILLHLDATPASTARLALARRLAERQGARLTALFGIRIEAYRTSFAYSASAALRAAEEQEPAPHQQERARLRQLCAESDPPCGWCEVAGDTVTHGFQAEAAYADLLVLGQQAGIEPAGGAPPGFVESVILDGGTPAIVVPQACRQETIGQRVLVAWNGSAQAARAMRAALPILAQAAEVRVVSWSAPPLQAPFSRLDAPGWLQRHGIAAQAHRRDPSSKVAEELAALALELNSDLVVMGCYGHTRLRERVFGGVTRSLLASEPVAVLMAH